MYVVYEPDIASLHRYIEGLGNCFVSVGWFEDRKEALSYASVLEVKGRFPTVAYHPESYVVKSDYVGEIIKIGE